MKKYCLVGYPVKHSLSAYMHNAAFRDLGMDAEYSLVEKTPDELKAFFGGFASVYSGCNVTIPHKEAVIRYIDDVKGEARAAGAVNTVVAEGKKLVGYNTDQLGFVQALQKDLGLKPKGKKAVVFGAGGAARAVCFGLHSLEVKELVITDIEADKAVGLAMDLVKSGCTATAVEHSEAAMGNLAMNADLIVNATPCGMKETDAALLPEGFLQGKTAVFDLIYNPKETPLLRSARASGCRTANGLGMLLYQGAESFRLWTKKEPPVDVMRQALLEALERI